MQHLRPVVKATLTDGLVERVQQLVTSGEYVAGQRLPAITEMARRLGVGTPTLREAIKKLEAIGLVTVRHGSGVYVAKTDAPLFVTNPVLGAAPSKKLLLDLIDARLPIEATTIALAARHATPDDLARMARVLDAAGAALDDPERLGPINMRFHCEIAAASGNVVFAQLVEGMVVLFRHEQRVILDIHGPRDQDHRQHVALFDAIRAGDESLARDRMLDHLGGVRAALERWDPAVPLHA